MLSKNFKKPAISVAVGVFALGFLGLLLYRDREAFDHVEWFSHPELIMLHGLLLGAVFALFVVAWHLVVVSFGCPLSIQQAARTWLMPNLGKYIPGKILMLAGRVILCRQNGMSRVQCLGAITVEHILVVLSASLFTVAALSVAIGLDGPRSLVPAVACLLMGIIFLACPHLMTGLFNAAGRKFGAEKSLPRLRRSMLLVVFLVYVFLWSTYGLSGVVLTHAMDMGSQTPTWFLMCAFVAAWLSGFLSFLTPGGIGVREVVLVVLLQSYLSPAQGAIIGVLHRLTWTTAELLGVALSAAFIPADTDGRNSGLTSQKLFIRHGKEGLRTISKRE